MGNSEVEMGAEGSDGRVGGALLSLSRDAPSTPEGCWDCTSNKGRRNVISMKKTKKTNG